MAICSFEGAGRLTLLDKGYWNVVSIHGPQEQKASLPHAKRVYHGCFDDVAEEGSVAYRSPRREDVMSVFEFLRSLPSGSPKEPVLIHCQQGLSRSTALALSWIYGQLPDGEERLGKAVDLVLNLRPQAIPNRLVLRFGLEQFMSATEADELAERIWKDPRLRKNQFLPPDILDEG